MTNSPKVSVITFAYVNETNGRYELLRECIESIRNQNYPNYEHIIIDDGSDIDLSHLENDYDNLIYIKKLGTGIISSTYTFNLGHELATGDYCIYLPSDDLHVEGAIACLVDALEIEPTASMAIGKAIYEYIDGSIVTWAPDKDKIENKLHEGNYINGCAVMWRRSNYLYACLPPNYTGFCCDYDLWATISKLGRIVYPDADVVKYRHVSDSTRNKTRSSFIVSPRKEDKVFYQYSKESRIEFVRLRCRQSIEHIKKIDVSDFSLGNAKQVTLSIVFPNSIIRHLVKRKWDLVNDFFEKNSKEYRDLKKELLDFEGEIIFQNLSLSALCLIRQLSEKKVYILDDFNKNNWLIDYFPLPYIQSVINREGKVNSEFSSFIGL
ncbi:glycosyltransferase [Marinomonas primoryensis]|uniref:WcaA superfamily protein n=1 Tax=Marinomonas primoryensis TaxID=178399 RepID=A0A859D4V3_9GAMM|nr:glycosyltransferase [Marinomonas primoryensis]QKK81969.1 WcaA superfamily protein [Marinomonas primoryensis]